MQNRRQVRCKSCGNWVIFDQDITQCSHCQTELFPQTSADKESLRRRTEPIRFTIPINPDDPLYIRLLKKVANAVQLVFMAIVSFIMWLIAMGPG